ncbi:MAG: TRAP transporter substrate-binding protein DctP [Marinobacter sp.]|nr:TRAP transporter substrate-binding protein DctP [Marinobacter sp.]
MIKNKISQIQIKPVFLAAALSFSAGNALAADTLKFAIDSSPKDAPAGQALTEWSELVEKYSDGEIEARTYYQNELGGQQEVFDLLVTGDVDAMLTWPMTSYDKRIGVVYAPYMVTNWDQALQAYAKDGWMNGMLEGIFSDLGIKFLGPWPEGFNGVATRGQVALNPEEARELTVRTIPVFPFPQTMQSLGYRTASIDWGEVYTALQTGVVDGDSGNVIYWDYEYFRDTLDYYLRTRHMFMTAMFLVNEQTLEGLNENQREAIERASREMVAKQFKEAQKVDQMYVEKAIESGMTYVELDAEQLKAHAELARINVWPLMREELGDEIMDIVESNANQL